jgi:Protein of unknown function (DUF1566)
MNNFNNKCIQFKPSLWATTAAIGLWGLSVFCVAAHAAGVPPIAEDIKAAVPIEIIPEARLEVVSASINSPEVDRQLAIANKYSKVSNGSMTRRINETDVREWLRCSLGQVWTGQTCEGVATKVSLADVDTLVRNFNVVGYGGKHDWRVPTARDLASLRECSTRFKPETVSLDDGLPPLSVECNADSVTPTIEMAIFPNTPWDDCFLTLSPYKNGQETQIQVWDVHFKTGLIYESHNQASYVRLVR